MGCKQSKKAMKPEMPREPDLQLEFDQSDSFIEISDDEMVTQMPEQKTSQNLTPKLWMHLVGFRPESEDL